MSGPGYATYTPKRQSSSVSSIDHFASTATPPPPPHHQQPASPSPVRVQQPSSRPVSGLARPVSIAGDGSNSFHLQAPLPSRPKLPIQFSGLSTRSSSVVEPATSPPPPWNGMRHSDSAQSIATTASMPALHPSSSRSPPPPSSSRATPPLSSALPFASVPPGQSPFPANSPAPYLRARSPEKGPVAQVLQQAGAHPRRGKMPYQAGFQPQGVRRDRSDEFMEQRRKCGEARKLDEGRLARRLEKVRLPFLSPSFQCVYVTPPLNLFGSCSSWRFISRPKTCTRKNPQR
jgi:rabenosyn-5